MNNYLTKIKQNFLDKNNKISASKMLWYFRKNPDGRATLLELTPNCKGEENFMERIFWIENNIKDYLTCANPECSTTLKNIVRWENKNSGFNWNKGNHRLTCSNVCKHELHSSRTEEVNENRINTWKEKYGVENIRQHEDYNTFKQNNPMKNKENVEKAKNTCMEKYGVDNPSKSSEIMDKIVKRGYGAKDYIFPSGKVVRIRGYEWKALDELLKHYDESELEVSAKIIPKIKYQWGDDSEHYYFPDIFIEKDNLLIEVKSDYYMNKDFEKNMRKAVATKREGYNFKFMVFGG